MKKKVLFGIVIVLMLWGEAVFGGTLSVPSGYDTIQAAIDAAADGDVVTLADGTYTGEGNRNIDFGGKAITVQSENGPEACIIDCEDRGRGFYFHQGEGALSVLRGVTITNGVGFTSLNGFAPPHGGGGICCSGASPVIENCIITKNGTLIDSLYALGKGGGIYLSNASPRITRCRINRNYADFGGGIYCREDSSPTISDSEISQNWVSRGFHHGTQGVGRGGALYAWDSSPVLINCTLTGNRLHLRRDETGIFEFEDSTPSLINCIVRDNQEGAPIFGGNSTPSVTYSNIQGGYDGEGNIDTDPLFVDAASQNHRLMPASPCIDSGTASGASSADADGHPRPVNGGYDMGAYEFQGVPSLLPVVDSFSATPLTGKAPLEVTFTCVASDPENGTLTYSMDFGDGSATEQNSSGRFTHTYTLARGGANAVCTVSDDAGNRVVAPSVRIDFGPIRVPEHYSTIQEAIDAASDGDTVLVADGTYSLGEDTIEFKGKAITVCSENGPSACILTGGAPAVKFSSEDTGSAKLEGFTITNASEDSGSGIECTKNASPVIRRCIVTGRSSEGVRCESYASPTFSNCVIARNGFPHWAGGVYVESSSPRFINCTIGGNDRRGIYVGPSYGSSNVSVINSVVWGNELSGLTAYHSGDLASLDVRYSNIEGGFEGEGNINADPLFVDAENGDYHLQPESLCIDAGTTDMGAPSVDADGNPRPVNGGYDMGVYEFQGVPNLQPVVDSFSATPLTGEAPFEVTFTCVARDSINDTLTYSMDFGDGSATEQNSSGRFTHTYTLAWGVVNALCTVSDDAGNRVVAPSVRMDFGPIRVPEHFSTIQEAIDAASDGDMVLVADGTYFLGEGTIEFKGKAITVCSENGPAACILSGGAPAVAFSSEATDSVLLEGFTIVHGPEHSGTGVLCMNNASPVIRRCIITDRGANGITCSNSASPIFDNCIITRNGLVTGMGYGVRVTTSSPRFINCTIGENGSFGIYVDMDGGSSNVSVLNSVIWGNPSSLFGNNDALNVRYSNIEGGFEGEGNINVDPLFFDAASQNYRLMPASPCIDSGTASGATSADAGGNPRPVNGGYDMGAYEFQGVPSLLPVVDSFSATPLTGKAPFEVTFTCVASDPENDTLTYSMDFGDGSATEQNSSGRFTHTYTLTRGSVNALCTVSDDAGNRVAAPSVRITFGPIRVPEHFSTIQEAIDAANDGDTVLVADGTYSLGEGTIEFKGKAITVCSENGPAACILSGGAPAVEFSSKAADSVLLEGFTIIHGPEHSGTGVLCMNNASPVVRRCIITDRGANGIKCSNSASPIFNNCIITRNGLVTSIGYGARVTASSPRFINCTIGDNGSSGIYVDIDGGPSNVSVLNSIIWGNPSSLFGNNDALNVRYSNIEGGFEGEGNINADPLFADAENGNYHLQAESPCVDAGSGDNAPDTDVDKESRPMGTGVDMGADELFVETPEPGDSDGGGGGSGGCFIGTIQGW